MKKTFICAVAAIATLAACTKSETLTSYQGEEVSFQKINSVLTKAGLETEQSTMGVYAVDDKNVEFFGNTEFTNKGGSWGATPAIYYPASGSYNFTVYAPYKNDITISNGNISYKVPADLDFLYGAQIYAGQKGMQKPIAALFKHSKSKVLFRVHADLSDIYTINSITLNDIRTTGTIKIAYSISSTPEITWEYTPEEAAGPYAINQQTTLKYTETPQDYGQEIMFIPEGNKTSFDINYTLNGKDMTKNIPIQSNEPWLSGKRYIFNLYFTTTEILFTPSVEVWEDIQGGDNIIETDKM